MAITSVRGVSRSTSGTIEDQPFGEERFAKPLTFLDLLSAGAIGTSLVLALVAGSIGALPLMQLSGGIALVAVILMCIKSRVRKDSNRQDEEATD